MDGSRYGDPRTASDARGLAFCPLRAVRFASPMLRRALILVTFVALACAAAPGATRTPTIAPGVIVGGLYVGDLTSEPARADLAAQFGRPIPIVYGEKRWRTAPNELGAGAAVNRAVAKALAAPPGSEIPLDVRWSQQKVDRFVGQVAAQIDRAPVNAELLGVSSAGPQISDAADGIAVRRDVLRRKLERKLSHGLRTRVVVSTEPVPATRTRDNFGSVIWIDRGSNSLRLYDGANLVQSFGVATGQSKYP